jgi:hypothetical protein
MSADPGRQIDGEKIMAEIGAIPAILAFPAEIFAQLDELCELRGFTHHRLALKLSGVSKTAGGRSEKKC